MIKNLIFDLGGVYFTNGTKLFYDKYMKEFNISREKFKELFSKGYGKELRLGNLNIQEFWDKVLTEVNMQIDADEYTKKWHDCYEPIIETRELIKELKHKGCIISGLTNNFRERIDYLDNKYSFKKDFDHLFFSFETKLFKPDINCYKYVLDNLELKPEDCVFIDDAEKNLISAKQLGMKTILFENAGKLREELK